MEIGFKNHNKQYDNFEVIKINGCNNITIRFENGEILSNLNTSRVGSSNCNILPPSKKNVTRTYEKHGDRYTKLWKEWNTMLWRCNPKNKRHHVWYSDNGIKVCDEWMSYIAFKKWALNNGFEENLTIDRIDSTKGYCPKNCRWLTQADNIRNIQSSSIWIPILKYDISNNFIEKYKTIREALSSINMKNYKPIHDCCKGKRKEYKGFVWKYED